jgi:hypothetical protein
MQSSPPFHISEIALVGATLPSNNISILSKIISINPRITGLFVYPVHGEPFRKRCFNKFISSTYCK